MIARFESFWKSRASASPVSPSSSRADETKVSAPLVSLSLDSSPPEHLKAYYAERFRLAAERSKNSTPDSEFKKSGEAGSDGYLFNGRACQLRHYRIRWPGLILPFYPVIEGMLKVKGFCRICDVGGGEGGFLAYLKKIFGKFIKVVNLTADATNIATEINKETEVVIGDMHNFSQLPGIKSSDVQFDLMTSFFAFDKTKDPLRIIAHLYEKLAKDGVIYIDRFYLEGYSGFREDIIKYLQSEGHKVAAHIDSNERLQNFTLIKTDKKLNFPVYYAAPDSTKTYTPSPALLAVKKQREQEEEKTKVNTSVHQQLKDLLESKSYEEMKTSDQARAIKQIVATMSPAEIKKDREKLKTKDEVIENYECYHKIATLAELHGKDGLQVEQITTVAAAELAADRYIDFWKENMKIEPELHSPECPKVKIFLAPTVAPAKVQAASYR